MPHLRDRYLSEIIKKRLRYFPVIGIQGALLANGQWCANVHEKIFYYQTPRHSLIHFVIENRDNTTALKIIAKESTTKLDVKILQALPKKLSNKKVKLIALGSFERTFSHPRVHVMPWESLV